jgi:EAL domain-containing protein (putative c-di-GMP-specific phosphodiesterase class I)/GGDEF domain-containing protein
MTIQTGIRNKLNNVIEVTSQNCSKNFEEEITKDFEYLKSFNNNDVTTAIIPSDFEGVGYITIKNNEYILNYNINNSIVENNKSIFYNNFELINTENNIFKIKIYNKDHIVYSIKSNNTYNLFFISEDVFFNKINLYTFEDVTIINATNKIVFSTSENTNEYFDISLIKNDYNYNNINDEQKLIISENVNGYSLRLVSYTSAEFIQSYIENLTKQILIFVIVMIIMVLVSCCYLLFMTIRGDYKSLYKEGSVFFLKIDNMGKIISRDKAFKNNFNITNIFEYVYDKQNLSKDLNNGTVILNLLDNNNQKKYISFKSVFDNMFYRLIGNDVTELFSEIIDTKKMLNCDMITGLQQDIQYFNDFDKAIKENYFENFAVAVIEITNSAQLKTMFGNDTFYKMQKIVSDELLSFYSPQIKVYYNIEDTYILFANNTIKAEALILGLAKNIEKLELPIHVNDNAIKLVCKAGINKISDNNSASVALRDAKVALKYSKLSKNKSVMIYDSRIMKSALAFYETKASILELINSNKFNVYYQPQFSLNSNKVVGFEALTRFNSPELKNISVLEFFEAAEKNGAIIEIGTAIYEKAMEFAKRIEDKNVTISLNVSPIQLLQEGFSEKFLTKFRSLQLKSNSICIEITESFLMQSYDDIINKLLILKNNGILIHLDDFGMVYSSMLYLNKLPINALKIDREFVRDILNNEYSKTMVKFMITLSHDLNLKCIIEGVENIEQSDIIKDLGGDIIQGYYISQAISPDDAIKMLEVRKNDSKRR